MATPPQFHQKSGRPPVADPRVVVTTRVPASQYAVVQRAASAARLTVSAYVAQALTRAARREK